MRDDIDALNHAILDLVSVINSPQPDAALIAEAGISLDRALFPLLVRIARNGPLGVVELADQVGRDYSTVSRQLKKMEALGLIVRRPSSTDGRMHAADLTARGASMAKALNGARERLYASMLADWNKADIRQLIRLTRRLADDARRTMILVERI